VPLWSSEAREGLRRVVPLDDPTRIPTTLRLEWVTTVDATQFAWIPVNVEDRALLPVVDQMRALTVDEILAFLLSGKPPWEVLTGLLKRTEQGVAPVDVLDPHKLVDTSHYVTVRTRRFSQALAVLRARLADEQFATVDALRARLLGPFGPKALAEAVLEEAKAQRMPDELAFFFLTELALILRWSPAPRMLDPKQSEAAEREWGQLRDSVDALLALVGATTGANFRAYSQRVLRVRPPVTG
jgi:hypothetical protein